jgi:hypothetical protein
MRILITEEQLNRIVLEQSKNDTATNIEPKVLDDKTNTLKKQMKGEKIGQVQKCIGLKGKDGKLLITNFFGNYTEQLVKKLYPEYDASVGITQTLYNKIINNCNKISSKNTAQSTKMSGTTSGTTNLKTSGNISFPNIVDLAVKHIEGGYYNPAFKIGGMGDSGETMFGMDRKHGTDFTNSSAGREFWGLIDADRRKNSKKWKYLYTLQDNPDLANKLKTIIGNNWLAPNYEDSTKRYLTPEAKKVVDSDPKLKFHMSYGLWNGIGWFNKFAQKLNNAINSGVTDSEKLHNVALNSRIQSGNKLITKGGRKIQNDIFPEIA